MTTMVALRRRGLAAGLAVAALCHCAKSSTSAASDGGPSQPEAGGESRPAGLDAAGSDGSLAAIGDSTAPTNDAPPPSPGIRWVGRADTSSSTPGSLGRFAWSASGFVASVTGSTISVMLQTEGATSSAFFMPVIDGKPGTRFQVMIGAAQTVVLATGLSGGSHTVEVYRESEGMFGDDVFFGFQDGTLGPPPPPSGRLIEIVGDSISAGYGNLGMVTHPPYSGGCTFSLDTQSAYASYGAVLARELGAEVSIVAHSGWGMVRDLNGNTSNVMPSIYANTLGTEASPVWPFDRKPDAVVVDLGTNDSSMGDPGQPFEDAYVAFLRTVRGHYPAAWIFLTIGPMTSDPMLTTMRTHLGNVVRTMGDSKITTVDIPAQDTSTTGCDFHPTSAEDMIMASTLAPVIKGKLGW